MPAFLIQILVVLLVLGVVLWGVTQIPMDPTIAKMVRVVVIMVAAVWLIYVLVGLLPMAAPLRR